VTVLFCCFSLVVCLGVMNASWYETWKLEIGILTGAIYALLLLHQE